MTYSQQRVESMLFNNETINRTDFCHGDNHEYPKTVYKARPSHDKQSTPLYKSTHTITAWKGDMPSFSLFHRPKELIRTHPNDIQQPYDRIVDDHREEAQKTRPRVVMTPTISMDDITDPSVREIVINNMYMSETSRSLREAVASIKYDNVKAPLPGRPAPTNPFVLQKYRPPLVAPEWRMDSVKWDQNQLRGYCDPTRRFWSNQELLKCKLCEETEAVRTHRKMLKDIKRGSR